MYVYIYIYTHTQTYTHTHTHTYYMQILGRNLYANHFLLHLGYVYINILTGVSLMLLVCRNVHARVCVCVCVFNKQCMHQIIAIST